MGLAGEFGRGRRVRLCSWRDCRVGLAGEFGRGRRVRLCSWRTCHGGFVQSADLRRAVSASGVRLLGVGCSYGEPRGQTYSSGWTSLLRLSETPGGCRHENEQRGRRRGFCSSLSARNQATEVRVQLPPCLPPSLPPSLSLCSGVNQLDTSERLPLHVTATNTSLFASSLVA